MKYEIIEQTMQGEETLWHGLTKTDAIRRAKKVARHTDANIYIAWFRRSDGQHGYLNPSGDHAITGEAW